MAFIFHKSEKLPFFTLSGEPDVLHDSYILPVIANIDDISFLFIEERKLGLCFRVNKVYCSQSCIVDAVSIDQILMMNT